MGSWVLRPNPLWGVCFRVGGVLGEGCDPPTAPPHPARSWGGTLPERVPADPPAPIRENGQLSTPAEMEQLSIRAWSRLSNSWTL